MVDLQAALQTGGVECVALCDVDSQHLAEAAAQVEKLQGSRPRTFKHYGDLLDTPGLRAVIIATPPALARAPLPGRLPAQPRHLL
jgi:predicted dehydrogenase